MSSEEGTCAGTSILLQGNADPNIDFLPQVSYIAHIPSVAKASGINRSNTIDNFILPVDTSRTDLRVNNIMEVSIRRLRDLFDILRFTLWGEGVSF